MSAAKQYDFRLSSLCLKVMATAFMLLLYAPSVAIPSDVHDNSLGLKPNIISLDITTHLGDQQTFLEGDAISFLLSLDTDAYLLVIYEDATGNLIQIIPNSTLAIALYRAGLFITIPDQRAAFRFKVRAPFGQETLWAFASDVPLPKLEGKKLSNGLKQLDAKISAIRSQLIKHPQSAFGETKLLIHTKARNLLLKKIEN